MIIVVDEPTSSVKYGSVVAAPYISELMEKLLPYLEYRSKIEDVSYTVKNYVGMNINSAVEELKKDKIAFEVLGNGSTVIAQTPSANDAVTLPFSKIILYTEKSDRENIIAPSLVGLSVSEALAKATSSGLNVKIIGGGTNLQNSAYIIVEQSIPPNMMVKRGSVIVLRIISQDFED
jgi:stage V sporulation protein D (sporulation-specific penicillin-binding protein)